MLPDSLFDNLDDDWTQLGIELGDALLASYLLGLAHVRAETGSLELAEGDPPPKMAAGPIKLRFNVPPAEAIEYFRSKKLVTKKEFGDLRHEAQSAAFTVGGIFREEVLAAFRDEIAAALENGTPQAQVIKRFKAILNGAGHKMLGDFHLETIWRTNMQIAYGVGRRRGLEEVADDLPYWMRNAVLDDRTRPAHAAMDGLTLPANHPFWDEHYPPDGFNCRCNVIAVVAPDDGYNPENPSGNYKLAYNDKGIPVSASDGMQVHNLSGGKFKGVPRQAGLRATIETAAEHARQSRNKNAEPGSDAEYLQELQNLTKPDRNYKPPAQILESARRFQQTHPTEEVMHIFDAKGRFVREVKGDAESVETPDEDVPKVNGGSTVHWHPPEGGFNFESFSLDDIIVSVKQNEAETFVATARFLYSLRPPNGKWTMELLDNIIADHERYWRQFKADMRPRLVRLVTTLDEAEDLGRHLIWKKIAKKYKMRYKQIRL